MAESSRPAAPAADDAVPPALPRLVGIDIVRGLAILWVITYHLWSDMTLRLLDAPGLYSDFGERVTDGRALAALTALTDLIMGLGYLGVPLFMMLSGVSLTLNAYRKGEPKILAGYRHRFSRVLPVYWAGLLLALGTVAVIAYLHTVFDGGSFQRQWGLVGTATVEFSHIGWSDVGWAFSLVGWAPDGRVVVEPVGSLWFVPLLLQYYLIFPFALVLLRKVGPARFTLVTLALVIAARAVFVPLSNETMDSAQRVGYLSVIFVLRGSEFFLGMTIGYLLACRRDDVRAWMESAVDTAGVIVLGVLLVMCAVLIERKGDAQLIVNDAILNAGLALVVLPLLFKTPGRVEASIVARALVALGIVSFTALVVNDQMRFVANFLREEDIYAPAWWFFLIVVYVPVGTLLAYPLAALFGLLPSQRAGGRTPVLARAGRAVATLMPSRRTLPATTPATGRRTSRRAARKALRAKGDARTQRARS